MADGRTSAVLLHRNSSRMCARSARSYSPNTWYRATKNSSKPKNRKRKTRRISEGLCLLVFLRSTLDFRLLNPWRRLGLGLQTHSPSTCAASALTIPSLGMAALPRNILQVIKSRFRLKSRRVRWYVTRLMCKPRVRLNSLYFNHQGKRRAEEPLADSLARADPPKSAGLTQHHHQPFMKLSTSLPPLATFPSANGSSGFVPALPTTTEASYSNTPFSFSFDGRSHQQ